MEEGVDIRLTPWLNNGILDKPILQKTTIVDKNTKWTNPVISTTVNDCGLLERYVLLSYSEFVPIILLDTVQKGRWWFDEMI